MIKNRLKNLKYTNTGIKAKQIVILNVIVGKFLLKHWAVKLGSVNLKFACMKIK